MATSTDTRIRDGLGTSALRPDGIPKVQGRFAFSSDAWADNMLWGARRQESIDSVASILLICRGTTPRRDLSR